jgi:hypothetical protein
MRTIVYATQYENCDKKRVLWSVTSKWKLLIYDLVVDQ